MISTLSLILAYSDAWSSPLSNTQLLTDSVAQKSEVIWTQVTNGMNFLADRNEANPKKPSSLDILISRGAEAIPYLVTQLSSIEPTGLTYGGEPFVNSISIEYYDPKIRKPFVEYLYTEADYSSPKNYKHTVTRGDLAYLALGQIVNRRYGILGGQVLSFCCPQEYPKVLQNAKKDWSNFTRDDLEKVLRSDVLQPDSSGRMILGFTRYRTYFPEYSVDLALECLKSNFGRYAPGSFELPIHMFFKQLNPIACTKLDIACYSLLLKSYKENRFLDEYYFLKYGILKYLNDRPGYREKCLAYAKQHQSDEGPEGYSSQQFLKESD